MTTSVVPIQPDHFHKNPVSRNKRRFCPCLALSPPAHTLILRPRSPYGAFALFGVSITSSTKPDPNHDFASNRRDVDDKRCPTLLRRHFQPSLSRRVVQRSRGRAAGRGPNRIGRPWNLYWLGRIGRRCGGGNLAEPLAVVLNNDLAVRPEPAKVTKTRPPLDVNLTAFERILTTACFMR